MAETRPTPDEPKQDSGIIRVLFKPGTSIHDMAETLVRLQDEVVAKHKRRQGENPPKAPE